MAKLTAAFSTLLLVFLLSGCNKPVENTPGLRLELNALAREASEAYDAGNFENAGILYADMIKRGSVSSEVAYNAACSFALAESEDLAFRYLMLAVKLGYHNVDHLEKDSDLTELRTNPRWLLLVQAVQKNLDKHLATINREVYELMIADQADREKDFSILPQEELKRISERDKARRTRIEQIVNEGGLKVADDFFNAALIFQHGGDSISYLMAHTLSKTSAELDSTNTSALWLTAASWDRYLQSVGKPQIYGTQYFYYHGEGESNRGWTMEPYDTNAVTDEERQHYQVPPLAAQRATLREMMGE